MIDELIQQIQSEITAERDTVVKRAIEEQLKNFIFDEKNLSPTLIALIMAKSSGSGGQSFKIPIGESEPIPFRATDCADESQQFISADISAIVNDLKVGNNVYLYGKAGTGKTTLAKNIAKIYLKRPTFTINCNQFTSPVEIRGGQTIEGYKDGNLVLAWENGGVLILDELPKLDPNTAGLLNEALALSADQPQEVCITKEDYEMFAERLKEAEKVKKYLGYSLYTKDGKYYQQIDVTITDGKGDLRKRGKGFCVIGTGNTDMKTTSTNYSGNNRQDYSLVDRFAGSYYEISYDVDLERSLTYDKVYNISIAIRNFLNKDASSVEFVSLRTMLNFNRIYEQEVLREIGSPYAIKQIEIIKKLPSGSSMKITGKTLADSINSFIDSLPEQKRIELRKQVDINGMLMMDTDEQEFINEFKRLHDNTNPLTGKRD